MRRSATLVALAIATTLLVALLAGHASAQPAAGAEAGETDTVVLQLRIWQRVTDPQELWLSARQAGARWDELGTFRLPDYGISHPYYDVPDPYPGVFRRSGVTVTYGWPGFHPAQHRMSGVFIAGIGLRVLQRALDPSLIFLQVHDVDPDPPNFSPTLRMTWRPLGMVQVLLDDGLSSTGSYRYGDVEIAVPPSNPGLLADREYLLALRDVLEGDGPDLDWTVDRPTADWQGVTLGGTPMRVTGLDLAQRGLTGEIWGWLGDLSELTELRLDRNSLSGMIPTKLESLTNLNLIRLGGNTLTGCVPPALLDVEDHDLETLDLPNCPPPTVLSMWGPPSYANLAPGAYWMRHDLTMHDTFTAFDVPPGHSITVLTTFDGDHNYVMSHIHVWDRDRVGYSLHDATDHDVWIFLDTHRDYESERSHYTGCVYDCQGKASPASLLEQIAASVSWRRSFQDHREN